MQIEIGNKIRQLRQRDGRKQEDLANALGVTNQAVSRWEASGGYPDMEMIPAIANYFNVSIDELFGYSSDRQAKLQSILVRAEKAINEQGDMTECVEMLRSAAEEFPSEPQVLIKLGYALSMHGWKKYGARSYTKDGSDYAHEDTEYNGGNIYWQEEIKVFEKVLGMDIPAEDRDTIVMMMVITYAKMGYYDKAKALAASRDSIISSRELLLTKAADAEERDRYCGEAIIALLTEIKRVIVYAVSTKVPLFTSPESSGCFWGLQIFTNRYSATAGVEWLILTYATFICTRQYMKPVSEREQKRRWSISARLTSITGFIIPSAVKVMTNINIPRRCFQRLHFQVKIFRQTLICLGRAGWN